MLASLMTELGVKIMSGLIIFLIVLGSYFYWKNEIVSEALNKSNARLMEQSKVLLKEKEEEVERVKKQILDRTYNAIQIYSNHYDNLRNAADRIPERVFINTKNNCSSNSMSRTAKDRSKTTGGIGGTGQAELPRENIRELDKTIQMIEKMQLKCELVLNSME